MKKIKIKFVRKANAWCVTLFEGKKQSQEWFGSEEEAREFIKENV